MMTVEPFAREDLPDELRSKLESESLFSSAGFCDLWKIQKGSPIYWCVLEGSDIATVMPGIDFGVRPIKRFQAMPEGCYAQIAGNTDYAAELLRGVAEAGYARAVITRWDDNDIGEIAGLQVQENSALVIDISADDWAPPDKKLQSEIRKAEREGVSVTRFEASRHMAGFLELVRETAERQGRAPRYSEAFFGELAKLAERDDRVWWWHVAHDDKPAASHIYFVLDSMLLHWQGYSVREASHLKPNQFLLSEAARQFREVGGRYLNLGASPPGAEGLKAFKAKWGGEERTYRHYWLRSGLGKLL